MSALANSTPLSPPRDKLASTPPPMGSAQAYEDTMKTQESRIAADRAAMDNLRIPEVKPVPAPNVQPTDPRQIWGSAAMALAAIGSLMTRTPLTSALNAAAGVFKAYKENDAAAAQQAFQSWKIASENASNIAKAELATYRGILARNKDDIHTAMSEIGAAATAYRNETMAGAASQRNADLVNRLLLEQDRLSMQLDEAAPKLEEAHAFKQALPELQATPEYQQADPITKMKMVRALHGEKAPSQSNHGDGSKADLELASKMFNLEYPLTAEVDPTTGQATGRKYHQGAPSDFETWYHKTWPSWDQTGAGAPEFGQGASPPPLQDAARRAWAPPPGAPTASKGRERLWWSDKKRDWLPWGQND